MSATPFALTGTDEPVPEPVLLRAGPLTAELDRGALRAIRHDGVEVLRGIAYLVRDRDWGTLDPVFDRLDIEQGPDAFHVAFQARCADPTGATLTLTGAIAGRPDGTLGFQVSAEPDRPFETNRCGFCVLHPILGVAGRPVMVEHTDGQVEHALWPDLIEPWQPFMAIRALAHEAAPGLHATCRLEGDTFEMEDQRNWSDASYKTYVRPLALPWPYTLEPGRAVVQSVTLEVRRQPGVPALLASAGDGPVTIEVGGPAGTHPWLGLVVTPEETGATLAATSLLADLAPQLLLFHLDPLAGHGEAALAGFARVAALGPATTTLEIALPCRDGLDAELGGIADAVRRAGLRLDAVVVSPSVDRGSTPPGSAWPDCPPLEAIYAAARHAFPDARLGGGMLSYFTELNRKRPPVRLLDLVTHCTCPIVHAADDRSVMQTLEALPFITRSTRAIIGDRPYRIGPSTIGMRQNPYGSRTMDNPGRRRVCMARADPRQDGMFAAAWLVGYAAATTEAGLEALTVGALTGELGLVAPEGPRPVFHAAHGLARLAGLPRLACRSSDPARVLAVAGGGEDGLVLWIANLTDGPQPVTVPGVASACVARLASGGLAAEPAGPLVLGAYGVVCLTP